MLQPSYRLIQAPADRSFVVKYEPFDLTTRWHYHPEVELIYFISGNTSCIIGDNFEEFEAGDLVILGANFPHVLQHSRMNTAQQLSPYGLIIQFSEDFMGKAFLKTPEMQPVDKMLQKARRGIQFDKHRSPVRAIKEMLLEIPKQRKPAEQLMLLLQVLLSLADEPPARQLLHTHHLLENGEDEERIKRVYEKVYNHFQEKLSIQDVAAEANMTETSFCRYFKSRTLKTFSRFLNEVRVAYACKLLKEPDCSVTDACFASGFSSLSYFNRRFKAIIGLGPRQFQQEIMRKLRADESGLNHAFKAKLPS